LYANKIITSGEGGAIVGSFELIERIKKLKSQSQDPNKKFSHNEIGYNYRITNLQSAIFNAQWSRKEKLLKSRNKIFRTYEKALRNSGISYSMNIEENDSPWLMTIKLRDLKIEIDHVMSRLLESGIETRPGFTAMCRMDYISKVSKFVGGTVNSEALSTSIISLPTYPGLTSREILFIVHQLSEAISIDV
jgi:perosamine synthetase